MSTIPTDGPAESPAAPQSTPVVPAVSVTPGEVPAGGEKASASYIWFQILAQFGVFVAFITPLAISLAIRLSDLAPGRDEYLGYITGSGALVVMLTAPLFGVLSDRTRTRFGRRRPWMGAGTVLGGVSLVVMALAPNALVLGAGWILAQLGWGQVLQNLLTSMADKLSEAQRGKVAGLVGFVTQIAPVVGVALAGSFSGDPLLLFLLPGIFGVVCVALFVLFTREEDTREARFDDKLSLASLFSKYLYNPRKYVDFSWVWLGRFFFYFGLTLNTTFTAFFFASRLGIPVADVAPIMATLSLVGVLATTVGALGGGFLSDRLRRRRIFVLLASLLFAAGTIVMALSTDVPVLVVGSLIVSTGIGMFSAVDQALVLDVLPEKESGAGRFMGIIGFATSIPQSVAPFVAPAVLAIGAASVGDRNYTLLYLVAGVFTVVGGLVVLRVRAVR
ncbi:MFS transporter [Nocardia sp. NPDC058499]|uniref:MFS transporter n=1 Tax=Nocardia sp. NPDC058499 TaxID=3346530 RepID=UPI003660C373